MKSALSGSPIAKVKIRYEADIVTARQKTRRLSALLGYDNQDQIRLSTAVSELARNAFQYASGGTVEFNFSHSEPQSLLVRIVDNGPGIQNLQSVLNGTYVSKTGMGLGFIGTKKLMDSFDVETNPIEGTKVTIGKNLGRHAPRIGIEQINGIADLLNNSDAENPFEEIQNQNRDLLNALDELQVSKDQLHLLNLELAKAEEAQKASSVEATMANEAKTRFLSNMSHEIRTPLGVIQGFADLAMDVSITLAERHEYLRIVKRTAHNLTKLLGQVLDLAKIEAGRDETEITRFSLRDLVSEVVQELGLKAGEKGISLAFNSDGPFPEFVESDQTRLRQVLTNLLSNSIKFTEHGGVEVHVSTLQRIHDSDPVFIAFVVRDSGIDLSKEQQARLFEAFMQADSSTTRKFGGTGLGLNLSKKLTQSLGGDLVLSSSEVGKGSVFTFTFNAGDMSAKDFANCFKVRADVARLPKVASAVAQLNGMTVLLVEDSLDNQVLFSSYLKDTGAKIDLASDGVEGVNMARKFSYDAILMDVQMPNLDGYGATKALRRDGALTPIIALTAHVLKEERDRALSMGWFTAFLTKPLERADLVQTLARYLPVAAL